MVHAISIYILFSHSRFPCGHIVCLLIFVITWFIFLPFFKAYDISLLKQEKIAEEQEAAQAKAMQASTAQ